MKSIWKYQHLLPSVEVGSRILLGEGQTPLIRSRVIGPELGIPQLYFKLENLNPSGSYKDRFAAMFVSYLQSKSIPVCLSTSSGNTGAALAAYCAAANIKCILAIVDGAPQGKIKQMQVYGAETYMIKEFGKDAQVTAEVFDFLEATAAMLKIPLPISAYRYCSEGMAGVQSIAYEIMEETGGTTTQIFSPAGGGGLTLAIARGARIYGADKPGFGVPKVNCVQPEGNDTIATALRKKSAKAEAIKLSSTTISGLQVPGVLDGDHVIEECRRLGGTGYVVTDEMVYEFQRKLALQEGIFSEPAGAVAVAGFVNAVRNNEINSSDKAACIITGSGFKDMALLDEHYKLGAAGKLDNIKSLTEIINQFI